MMIATYHERVTDVIRKIAYCSFAKAHDMAKSQADLIMRMQGDGEDESETARNVIEACVQAEDAADRDRAKICGERQY